MTHESPETETTFGYLTAVHSPEYGYFGGYLIVSAIGRPLEFHCTAPVLPSRAQQILYGPTLQPYLIGDQIGGTLLAAAKLVPRLILTNRAEMVGLRSGSRAPLVLIITDDARNHNSARSPESARDSLDASGTGASPASARHTAWGVPFSMGDHRLQLPLGYEAEHQTVIALLNVLSDRVELAEPFGRIEEAIREAQRIGGRGPDTHATAA